MIYAVPGIGWAVATLAVILYHRERGELAMNPIRLAAPWRPVP